MKRRSAARAAYVSSAMIFVPAITMTTMANDRQPAEADHALRMTMRQEISEVRALLDASAARETISDGLQTGTATSIIECEGQWQTPFNDAGFAGETIYALAVYDGDLIAGGTFTTAGGDTANHIARWDGESWSALGDGVNGVVRAMLVHNGSLYVGGHFTTAGDVAAHRIARWDGVNWHPIGDGFNNFVMAIAEHAGEIIAGGFFTHAGEIEVNRVARWDENTGAWQALGQGMNRGVRALASTQIGLVAGGHFTQVGGSTVAGSVAVWDGNTWNRLAGDFIGPIHAIGIHGELPLAAGAIQVQLVGPEHPENPNHGTPVDRILYWDDAISIWRIFTEFSGPTPNHAVNALMEFSNELHAAGKFTDVRPTHSAPPAQAKLIARWDGEEWQPLGEGLGAAFNASAEAMVNFNGQLVIAGFFETAGGETATSIAGWTMIPPTGSADLNCDGIVNGLDLILLLQNWGECENPDVCLGDINGDGTVDGADMLLLLANWG